MGIPKYERRIAEAKLLVISCRVTKIMVTVCANCEYGLKIANPVDSPLTIDSVYMVGEKRGHFALRLITLPIVDRLSYIFFTARKAV